MDYPAWGVAIKCGGKLRVRDVIKLIEADGWSLASTKGGHRQFKHPFKKGRVTVAGKLDLDLHQKTLKSILKQGGLKEREDD